MLSRAWPNTVRLNPFALTLRYLRTGYALRIEGHFPASIRFAYPVLSLSKGQPERILFLTEQYWGLAPTPLPRRGPQGETMVRAEPGDVKTGGARCEAPGSPGEEPAFYNVLGFQPR